MSDIWLSTLITPTPQTGYDLAIKLSRMAVKMTQPDENIRAKITTRLCRKCIGSYRNFAYCRDQLSNRFSGQQVLERRPSDQMPIVSQMVTNF